MREIQKRDRLTIAEAQVPQRPQLGDLRRDLRRRLQPLFADAGFNTNKINKLLASHEKKVRQLLKKQKAKADKSFSRLKGQHREIINNRRKALEHINGLPLIITPIIIETPFNIVVEPAGALVNDNIAPHNSWATFFRFDNRDTPNPPTQDEPAPPQQFVRIRFFFSWQNESDYAAVINATADLMLRGVCKVEEFGGWFSSGLTSLSMRAELTAYKSGTALGLGGQQITYVQAEGGGLFGDFNSRQSFVNTTSHLSGGPFIVNDHELVIFSVDVVAGWSIDEGQIFVDFSKGPDYGVTCPALVVGLLSPPTITTNLGLSPTVAARDRNP